MKIFQQFVQYFILHNSFPKLLYSLKDFFTSSIDKNIEILKYRNPNSRILIQMALETKWVTFSLNLRNLCKIIDPPFQPDTNSSLLLPSIFFLLTNNSLSLLSNLLFSRSSLKKKKKKKKKKRSKYRWSRCASSRFFFPQPSSFPFLSKRRSRGPGISSGLKWFIAPRPVLFLLNDESWCDFAWANNQSIYSEDIRRASSGKRLLISFDRSPSGEEGGREEEGISAGI